MLSLRHQLPELEAEIFPVAVMRDRPFICGNRQIERAGAVDVLDIADPPRPGLANLGPVVDNAVGPDKDNAFRPASSVQEFGGPLPQWIDSANAATKRRSRCRLGLYIFIFLEALVEDEPNAILRLAAETAAVLFTS